MWNWIHKKKNLWIVWTHQCCTTCKSACRFLEDPVDLVDLHVDCSADPLVNLCVDLYMKVAHVCHSFICKVACVCFLKCKHMSVSPNITALPKGVSVISVFLSNPGF